MKASWDLLIKEKPCKRVVSYQGTGIFGQQIRKQSYIFKVGDLVPTYNILDPCLCVTASVTYLCLENKVLLCSQSFKDFKVFSALLCKFRPVLFENCLLLFKTGFSKDVLQDTEVIH